MTIKENEILVKNVYDTFQNSMVAILKAYLDNFNDKKYEFPKGMEYKVDDNIIIPISIYVIDKYLRYEYVEITSSGNRIIYSSCLSNRLQRKTLIDLCNFMFLNNSIYKI